MRKFISCGKCQNGWIVDNNNEEVLKCECLKTYQNNIHLDFIQRESNLPILPNSYDITKYIGNDKAKNIDKLNKYINEFSNKFKHVHLYVYGSNSTQKTTVINWVAREIIKHGFSVKYILMNELTKILTKEQYEENIEEIIRSYYNYDLVILDESFDKKKLTLYRSGYQLPFIDQFLRNRLEKYRKSTIFISNVSPQNIHDDFGSSLKKLIERNCSNSSLEFIDNVNIKDNFNTEDLWK